MSAGRKDANPPNQDRGVTTRRRIAEASVRALRTCHANRAVAKDRREKSGPFAGALQDPAFQLRPVGFSVRRPAAETSYVNGAGDGLSVLERWQSSVIGHSPSFRVRFERSNRR